MSAPPPSRLDANQVLQGSFDEATGRLRTDANATVVNADIDVALDATEDNVAIADPEGDFLAIEDDGSINVNLNNVDFDAGMTGPQTLRTASNTYGIDPDGSISPNKESGEVTGNSTTTPLLAGVTWTGAWTEASQYSCVSFTIQTDVDSATNGVRVQYSHDGINVIRQSPATQIGSANGVFYSLPIHAKYFRLFYQNGSVNQTVFNVDCQLHEEFNGLAAVPINLPLTDTVTATTVKAVISGKSVDGIYTNARAAGVSTLNSTSTPLSGGGSFTGTFEDLQGYTNIALTVNSSHDSATDGLVLEYSTNGTDVDSYDVYTIFGGSNGAQFTVGVTSRYFRVSYTNGASAQTTFRLQTIFHTTAPKPSSTRVEDVITGQNDAELVKAITTGRTPDGIYDNEHVQGIDSGNSTTTTLNANDIYRGTWFQWSEGYVTLISNVKSDVAGSLFIDASTVPNPTNGVDTDIGFFVEIPFDPDVVDVVRRNTPLQSLWVRHRYVNGNAAQSTFNLSAVFTTVDPGSTHFPAAIMPTSNVLLAQTRAINTVPTADGDGYQDTPVDSSTGNPKVTVQNIRDDILLRALGSASATQVIVGIEPVRLDPSPVSNRRSTMISNDGDTDAAVGFSDSITFNSGSMRVPAGGIRVLPFSESVELWGIAEDAGGVQTPLTRTGTTTGGTATGAGNTLLSDNVYANITAAAQTATVTGYTAGTANPLVSVKIGLEGKKQSGQFETVAVAEVQSGATAGAGTVASASLAGGTQQLYVAFVSRNANTGTVTQVLGGGVNFTASLQNVTSGNRRIDVWYAYGTFSAGVVTASLSSSTNAHITVYRITNADPTTPLQTVGTSSGTGTAVTGPGIAGTNKGYSLLAISHTAASGTAGAGYTENADATNGAGANTDSLAVESKALVSTGTETGTYTLATSSDWSTIGVTISPAAANNPSVTLSYELSAVPGATSGIVTFTSTTDGPATVDVTGDRVWVVADIPNVTVIATGLSISAASADIDQLYLELIDTTGNTTRLSIVQGGEAVV